MIDYFTKYRILILCILGAIVRFLYGYIYEPWNLAPDQLAWELILEQGSFRYDHLIHYPHEGGSFIISLLSQIVQLCTSFSSLTILAFTLDFLVRFIQIFVVKRLFDLRITTLFGLWTIFATPSIIPWGTVNAGLHAIASVFPFILLLLLHSKEKSIKHYLFCGIFLGLAFWFSYSNIILVPVFLLYLLIKKSEIKIWLFSLTGLIITLLLHILVRYYFDAGFHLNEFGLTSIRGVDFSIREIGLLGRLYNLPSVVANSAYALPESNTFMPILRVFYYILFSASLIKLFIEHKKKRFEKLTYMIPVTILFFLGVYLVSPFFEVRDMGSYILLRHLSYIMPLISLFLIIGLSKLEYKIIVISFLILGMIRSGLIFTTEFTPRNDEITKASGWVLGTKFGHDKNVIIGIIDDNQEKKKLLIQGIGWGISASILYDDNVFNEVEAKQKVEKLFNVINRYPASYQKDLFEGIRFSFGEHITPRLNMDLLRKIKMKANLNR